MDVISDNIYNIVYFVVVVVVVVVVNVCLGVGIELILDRFLILQSQVI